jgi:hypothetical protein
VLHQIAGAAVTGNGHIRRDFDERHDYERALAHAWMGYHQPGFTQRELTVEKQIEIESARRIRKLTDAAMGALDREQLIE